MAGHLSFSFLGFFFFFFSFFFFGVIPYEGSFDIPILFFWDIFTSIFMERYFGVAFSFLIWHLTYIHLEEFWSMAFVCRAYGIGARTVNESWLVLESILEFCGHYGHGKREE